MLDILFHLNRFHWKANLLISLHILLVFVFHTSELSIAEVKRVVSHILWYCFFLPDTWDKIVIHCFSWDTVEHATCIFFAYTKYKWRVPYSTVSYEKALHN